MDRNCDESAIWMFPMLMGATLPAAIKSKRLRDSPEVSCAATRH